MKLRKIQQEGSSYSKDLLSINELLNYLSSYDIPNHRVKLNKHGIEWLLINLPKRNASQSSYNQVMGTLSYLYSTQSYIN